MRLVRWYVLFLTLTLIVFRAIHAEQDEYAIIENRDELENHTEVTTEIQSTTRDFIEDLQPLLKEVQRRAYPIVSALFADPQISNDCTSGLAALLRGVQTQEKWAFMIATAHGGLPQNFFLGAQGSFGSYDQCLEAKRVDPDGLVTLRGQYCTLYINPNEKMYNILKEQVKNDPFFKETVLNMETWPKHILDVPTGIKIGLCTPNRCSTKDLNYILDKLVNKVYGTEFEIGNCRIKHRNAPTPFQLYVFGLGYVLLILVIVGTLTDYYLNRTHDKPIYISPWFAVTFILMFSARRNIIRLFSPHTSQARELGFFNGIKVLLSCWVVYGHCAIFISPDVYVNISSYVLLLQKIPFQIVANGFMAVSSFYFISGFLLGYFCIKEKQRIIKQNPVIFITTIFIRRYIRLVIPILVVVCFSMLMPLWADSPNDKRSLFEVYARRCPQNWWSILALSSNFMGADGMCLGHSWYVSVDMQVFLVASIVCIIILSNPRVGLTFTAVLTLASCLWIAINTYVYEYSPIIGFTGKNFSTIIDTFDYIYVQPITHSGCYFLGIMCAYVCLHGKRLQWYTQTLCWVLAHGCASYVIFITVNWYRYGLPGPLEQSLYAGFHRIIFTFGLFWLIYACLHGMAPTLRRILEHSAFRALGRLAFGLYLVHFAVVYMQQGLMKSQAFLPNQYLLLQQTLGVLSISFGLAFLMNITVESPVGHLDNFIFNRFVAEMINQPQTHKEAEMTGRKTEMALATEQHHDRRRKTSLKESCGTNLDMIIIENVKNGINASILDTKPPVDSADGQPGASFKAGRRRVSKGSSTQNLSEKTKL
ncbi:nose resistant to fluoxetine protein 6-like [Varroa destructor]|uniref:Nose resistant-to-fluoxetine protein N-terminal domain-containing protein n=1 Tax=Varroa destructor TaxID=109461 RepID=A0A7M7J8Y4_VARDE|nr:nose resistant to fluoxetine protein 6-like [Varroa destructor]